MSKLLRPPRPREHARRGGRWWVLLALLALTPKCLLCVAAYVGVGAALGLSGREICGGVDEVFDSWMTSLAWGGAMIGAVAVFARSRGVRGRAHADGDVALTEISGCRALRSASAGARVRCR